MTNFKQMKIEKDLLEELVYGSDVEGWKFLKREFQREWRWGEVYDVIIQHESSGNCYRYEFKDSSGDGEYSSLDDAPPEVVLTQVWPKLVTVVAYVEEEPDAD